MTGLPYLPRGTEVELWAELVEDARRGRGATLTVGAAAGLGKSRLVDELSRHAQESGLGVLRAAGRSLGRNNAHGATRQLLEGLAGRDPGVFAGAAALARPLLEEGRTTGDSFALTHSLFWVVANLAAQQPVAVLVDDAQWLDPASVSFLSYLAERSTEVPVALLIAGRPRALDVDGPLAVVRARGSSHIELRPLRLEELRDLVLHVTPGTDMSAVDAICTLSAGNALLAEQLAHATSHPGAPARDAEGEQRDEADLVVRDVLVDHVRRRLAELDPAARRVASAAAVVGTGAPWSLAREVSHVSAGDLVESRTELIESRLLIDDDKSVRFAHDLVHEAVLTLVPRRELDALRHTAAHALLSQGRTDLATSQLMVTEPGGDPGVVDVLLDHARDERARGSAPTAVPVLRRALAEPPATAQLGEVTVALGDALLACGELQEASNLLSRAVRHASPETRLDTARTAARALLFAGDPVAGVRLLADVTGADRIPAAPQGIHHVNAEIVAIGQTQHDLALVPPETTPGADTLEALAARAMQAYSDTVVWRGRALDQVSRIENAIPDAVARLGIGSPLTGMLITGLVVSGGPGWTSARAHIDHGAGAARAEGSAVAEATYASLRARLSYLEGRLRESEADSELAVELCARANPLVLPFAVANLVLARCGRADLHGAQAALHRYGYAEGDVPATGMGANLLLARVTLRRLQDRLDEAWADVTRMEPFARGRARWPSSCTPEVTRVLKAAGRATEAQDIAQAHLERARAWSAPLHLAEALLLTAELHPDVEQLEEALEHLQHLPVLLPRAKALIALGAAQRRAGRRTLARELLMNGWEIAQQQNCLPLINRARTELAASGLRPRNPARTGVAALTASELRVARLAAERMTNAEIAQELYLSLKTVENHLTHAYAKLGATSRRDLHRMNLEP